MISKNNLMIEWKQTKRKIWKGTEFTLGFNLFYAILTYRQTTARNKNARMTDVSDIANYLETYTHCCYSILSDEQSDALNQIIDRRLLRGEFEPKADNSVYELIKQMSRLLDHPLEESLEVCRRDFETVFMDMIDQDIKDGQTHLITRIVSTFTNCVEILHEHKSMSELTWTESGSRQKRYISVLARVIEKYSDTRFISRFEARIQSMVTKRNDVSYFPMKTYCDVLLETEDLCQEFWKSSTIRTAQTGESYSSSYFSGNLDNSSTSEQQVQSNSNHRNVENEQRPCRPCEVLDNKTLYHKMTDCHHVKREMKEKSKNEFEQKKRVKFVINKEKLYGLLLLF